MSLFGSNNKDETNNKDFSVLLPMMAGNPNWWTTYPPSLIPPQYVLGSSSIPFNSSTQNPERPQSLSQLYL